MKSRSFNLDTMAIIKDYKSGEPKISNITKMHVRFSPLLDNFA